MLHCRVANRNPTPSGAGRCAWCGQPEANGAVVVPYGTEPGTHAWLHTECWPAWQEVRRSQALQALMRMGVTAGPNLGGLQPTEFVERGDYRDFTGSIPLLRIAASAASDPRKWINR